MEPQVRRLGAHSQAKVIPIQSVDGDDAHDERHRDGVECVGEDELRERRRLVRRGGRVALALGECERDGPDE